MRISIGLERRVHRRGLITTRGLGRRWSWSEFLGAGDPALSSPTDDAGGCDGDGIIA
jgi:hypothetical protein